MGDRQRSMSHAELMLQMCPSRATDAARIVRPFRISRRVVYGRNGGARWSTEHVNLRSSAKHRNEETRALVQLRASGRDTSLMA